MKNISNILGRSNLTPRERYLLLIQNDIHRAKTGEEILTPADKEALENWKAKDNSEAREWNRLNEGWKYTGKMELEVELLYKDAQVAHLAQLPFIMSLLYYPTDQEIAGCIKTIKNLKKVTLEEAVKIGVKQREVKLGEGLDLDYAFYRLAFELMDPEDRKKLNELYPDIETDQQYIDQEEVIANLYAGGKELTEEAKRKLSKLVAERSYNKFAKEYQLFHYFACIPLSEVGRRFLKSKGIEIKDKSADEESDPEDNFTSDDVVKAMKEYALKHGTTVEALLEEGCFDALNNGLLDEYMPLAASNSAELLERWLGYKSKAKAILSKHIEDGDLKIREHTEEETIKDKLYSKRLYDRELETAREVLENMNLQATVKGELDEKVAFETFDGRVITGESLYALKENYIFVDEFRKRIDQYDPNLGLVYADDDPERKGEHLDKELMICGMTDEGEASFFSLYGMATDILSTVTERKALFEDTAEDGQTFIRFKDSNFEKVFRSRRDELMATYAKLLAFQNLFKELSKEYETDMTYHVSDRIRLLKGYIEQLNDAILVATGEKPLKPKFGIFRRKDVLKFKEGLTIDIDAIKPDEKAVEEHRAKLIGILGEF